MRVLAIVFLLGVVSSSLAFHSIHQSKPFVMDTSFLKEMNTKKASFKGLTNLLQQDFRDNSQVTQFLQDLQDQLTTERAEQLAILNEQTALCQQEKEFRTEEVAEGEDAASRSQTQINLCSSERTQASTIQQLAEDNLVVYQDDLEDLESSREAQYELFQQRQAKLENVQNALGELLNYVQNVLAASNVRPEKVAFVQLTNKVLKATVRTGHSHLVLPIYTALLQMQGKQQYNAGDVQEVVDLIVDLQENAASTLAALIAQEATDLQVYQDAKAVLEALIAKLQNQAARAAAYGADMDACLVQENAILALAEDKVERNTELLQTAANYCQALQDQWTEAEAARGRQRALLVAIGNAVSQIAASYQAANSEAVGDLISLRLL